MKNKMKKHILLLLLFMSVKIVAQSKTVAPNYSFFKLLIKNNKNEVLLVKWGNDWELQGRKYKGNYSLKEFVENMGSDVGVKLENIKLRGLFTYHYKGESKPTLMHYYEALYIEGKLKIPPSCSDIKWYSFEDAMKIIGYSDMKAIMNQIKENTRLWSGALEINQKTKINPRTFIMIDDFYTLD